MQISLKIQRKKWSAYRWLLALSSKRSSNPSIEWVSLTGLPIHYSIFQTSFPLFPCSDKSFPILCISLLFPCSWAKEILESRNCKQKWSFLMLRDLSKLGIQRRISSIKESLPPTEEERKGREGLGICFLWRIGVGSLPSPFQNVCVVTFPYCI